MATFTMYFALEAPLPCLVSTEKIMLSHGHTCCGCLAVKLSNAIDMLLIPGHGGHMWRG